MTDMPKPGGFEVLEEGDKKILRINCVGAPFSPSIEDDPAAMCRAIDYILQVKEVDRVVMAEAYEYEYPEEQTAMLVEIAEVIDILLRKENILDKTKMALPNDDKYFPARFAFVESLVIDTLRTDPVGAYIKLEQELANVDTNMQALRFQESRDSYAMYVNNILKVVEQYLQNTALIKKILPEISTIRAGDRFIYQEMFSPAILPNFTLTRYMTKPPVDGELVDSYTIMGDTDIEVYSIPDKTERYYQVIPPEFKLPEDQYMALGLARKVMMNYKPSSTSFTQKTREYFERVGEDLIATVANERGLNLQYDEIKELAQILTRYTTGLGIIEILLADPKLQDIYINAPIGEIPIRVLHSDWEECTTNLIPTKEDAESMAARFRLQSGRPLDEAEPVLDTSASVPGGRARVCVVTKSLSSRGLTFAFRRHRSRPWTYPLFIKNKMMSSLSAGLLWFVVDGGRSILFAGPRSSGKTSMLAAMIVEIMRKYRILSIEDTLELPVDAYREMGFNVLSMKVQSAITKLEAEIPADEGIRTALRLGDSCLIIGEVRSKEAKALYEAMRVGALSNVVAGTIHGDDPYGVWDRVVNDLDVPTTSFKATDLLVMPAPIRSADGMHRYRRLVTITEVGKNWTQDPMKEGGLKELMSYDAKKDLIEPTKYLLDGNSEILTRIASRVKEWSGDWEAIWENIQLRANVKQTIVDMAEQSNNMELLEAPFVAKANNIYHIISEKVNRELGAFDCKEIFSRWNSQIKEVAKGTPAVEEVEEQGEYTEPEEVEWSEGEEETNSEQVK